MGLQRQKLFKEWSCVWRQVIKSMLCAEPGPPVQNWHTSINMTLVPFCAPIIIYNTCCFLIIRIVVHTFHPNSCSDIRIMAGLRWHSESLDWLWLPHRRQISFWEVWKNGFRSAAVSPLKVMMPASDPSRLLMSIKSLIVPYKSFMNFRLV